VWTAGHRTEDGQALSRHLRTVLTEQVGWIHRLSLGHDHTTSLILDSVMELLTGVPARTSDLNLPD
jgi:hypothetical protein